MRKVALVILALGLVLGALSGLSLAAKEMSMKGHDMSMHGMSHPMGDKEYTVGIDGMFCDFCVYKMEQELKARFTLAAPPKVSLETASARFKVKGNVIITPAQIEAAVTNGGFTLRDIRVAASGMIMAIPFEGGRHSFTIDDKNSYVLVDEFTETRGRQTRVVRSKELSRLLATPGILEKEVRIVGVLTKFKNAPSLFVEKFEVKNKM